MDTDIDICTSGDVGGGRWEVLQVVVIISKSFSNQVFDSLQEEMKVSIQLYPGQLTPTHTATSSLAASYCFLTQANQLNMKSMKINSKHRQVVNEMSQHHHHQQQQQHP